MLAAVAGLPLIVIVMLTIGPVEHLIGFTSHEDSDSSKHGRIPVDLFRLPF
jgi:hypothetical protein